ncbi:COG4223 family protein [Jannaschia sp. 2305UL9-9]|uniref:COG4223 family protein n=1 Tax=Jannaschia sp. 2305UL9-9 TaxID=3121638 RepID=UPI0035298FB7
MARKTNKTETTKPDPKGPKPDATPDSSVAATDSDIGEGQTPDPVASDGAPPKKGTKTEADALSPSKIHDAVIVDGDTADKDGDAADKKDVDPSVEDDTVATGAGGSDTIEPDAAATTDQPAPLDGEVIGADDAAGPDTTKNGTTGAEDAAAPPPEREATPLIATAPATTEKRGSGFVPLVLGGLVAGAIGYAIPTFVMPPAAPPEADMSRIDALEARIADMSSAPVGEGPDLSGIEAAQTTASDRIDALETRIAALETDAPGEGAGGAPAADAGPDLSARISENVDTALADVRAEIDALGDMRADIAALGDRIDALPTPVEGLAERVSAVEEALDALAAETESVEATAEDLAREAAATQLRLAVDTGQPFADPLSVLGGDVPPALADAADTGVATTQTLASDFPDLARGALAEARRVEPAEGNPVTAFLRRQTGARSLEPREGSDADAVLSRAEAALRNGDVETALAELDALPPEAAEVLAPWTERAQARVAAQSALQDYLETE